MVQCDSSSPLGLIEVHRNPFQTITTGLEAIVTQIPFFYPFFTLFLPFFDQNRQFLPINPYVGGCGRVQCDSSSPLGLGEVHRNPFQTITTD